MDFDYLIDVLQKTTAIKVQEAMDKLPINTNIITIAPANYHLLVDNHHYALSTEPTVKHARHSIDVLMESVADQYGSSAVGIILTGGGNDGVQGLKTIKLRGGAALLQSPKTAENPTLPQAVVDAEITNDYHSVKQLAEKLINLLEPNKE